MLVTWNWLLEFVDIQVEPDRLADMLTMAGLEVEDMYKVGGGLNGVVTAFVVDLKPHPRSDHLKICRVRTGAEELEVICGAPNVRQGIVVPYASVGSRLPDGRKIEKANIRGIESHGMICSESELQIGEDASGIMILPDGIQPGVPIAEALELEDIVFDIGITPNRADCMSVLGIAREIAALTGAPLRPPDTSVEETGEDIRNLAAVEVQDLEGCPRYVARLIKDVKIGPSPFRMKWRLRCVGQPVINNVVDVTNYIMCEMGQPQHAFDLDLLEGHRIVVKRAEEGEVFITLDGKERFLTSSDLMICDARKSVGLAGVMGGINTEIRDITKNVLLESAHFDPRMIRRTSKRLGLSTEAAKRFERGVDPNGALKAANRAMKLMRELAGGSVARGVIDVYPRKIEEKMVKFRPARASMLLGVEIPVQRQKRILELLGMRVISEKKDHFDVRVPTFRMDLTREVDLIEEVGRVEGYHKIPALLPKTCMNLRRSRPEQKLQRDVREYLTAHGFSEVITYSYISPSWLEVLFPDEKDERLKAVRLRNPLSEDQSILRTTLIPGLLSVFRYNINHGFHDLRFFEIGRIFIDSPCGELPQEKVMLAGITTGRRCPVCWDGRNDEIDFFDIKGITEGLLKKIRIGESPAFTTEILQPFMTPGEQCEVIIGGERAGYIGRLSPAVLDAFEISKKAIIFEFDLDILAKHAYSTKIYTPFIRLPATYRDISLVVDRDVTAEMVMKSVKEFSTGLIKDVRVFDVYTGDQIPRGKVSMAFRIKYQAEDRSLQDDEVNRVHSALLKLLEEKLKAVIR